MPRRAKSRQLDARDWEDDEPSSSRRTSGSGDDIEALKIQLEIERIRSEAETKRAEIEAASKERIAETEAETKRAEIEATSKERIAEIQLERDRLAHGSRNSEDGLGKASFDDYARRVRGALPKMPEEEEAVPSWFRLVEVILETYEVPAEVQGQIVLGALSEKCRASLARLAAEKIKHYPSLKEFVLEELRLSPAEYLKGFRRAARFPEETWPQFASRLKDLYGYYVDSREVRTVEDLVELTVADHLKTLLPPEARKYVILQEGNGWSKPAVLAKHIEKFAEATGGELTLDRESGRQREQQGKPSRESKPVTRGAPEQHTRNSCHVCGKMGHWRRDCPKRKRSSEPDRARLAPANEPSRPNERLVARVTTYDQPEADDSLRRVKLACGGSCLSAIVDSGAEISVLRKSRVPAVTETRGKTRLVGAFGHQVEAGLASVPLGLWEEGREETPGSARVTCAITNRLGKATDALLTERDFRALVEAREKADSEARKRELAEEQSILSAVAGMFVEASEAVKREPPDDKNRGMVIGPLDQTQGRQRTAQCERRAQSEQNKAGDATPIARKYSGSESDSQSERPAANRKLEGEDADEGRPGVRAVKNGVAGTPQGQNCGVGEIIDLGDIGREPATQLARHADDQRRAIGETSEPLLGLPNATRDKPLDATKECHSVDDLAELIGQQANLILATVTRVQRKHSGEETRRSRATAGAASGQSEPPTHVLSPEGGISPVRKTTDNGHNRARAKPVKNGH
ncbi:plectin-like [Centruroides vittatus]|uniref:plectin-like n=1 Tax=Centruroides vittatus TaxID=120091 RepID=UPI00350EBA23